MRRPWFPYYVEDFELSGKVMLMSAEAEGCYHRLLRFQWREGHVPGGVREIAQICRQSYAKMRNLWPKLEPCFPLEGDVRRNPRLEAERAKADELSAKRSEIGKRGRAKQSANGEQLPDGCLGRLDRDAMVHLHTDGLHRTPVSLDSYSAK